MTADRASQFLFVVCQVGSEPACKREITRRCPDLRLAFSRGGFLTYKAPEGIGRGFQLPNAYARTWGVSHAQVRGDDRMTLASEFWREAPTRRFDHVHVWERDPRPVGERFEPFPAASARAAIDALRLTAPADARVVYNHLARPGEWILDCVLVDPQVWWIGWHRAASPESCWPGGVPPLPADLDVVARSYYKMREALWWSRMPIRRKDVVVEIGSAPGGASQALLEAGLKVWGVDPAEMDSKIAEHPAFRHIRKRGREVRRREFGPARWLTMDANVAPQHTLDTVEDIVQHPSVHLKGLLLTLKFPQWRLAESLDDYLERIRGWGFKYVRPRHLAFNRQEICVMALRQRALIRAGRRR